jgi:DNA-binding transcriptional LysR family regulator
MDRRRLQCFVALAEELHFNRAAIRCGISQPGLSQQLQQLEGQLQVQLLYRNKRRVSLTKAGETFYLEARQLLRSMDRAVQLARETQSGNIGRLVIGATAPALFILMPEIAQRIGAALRGVTLDIREMTTAQQEEALRRREIHAGIVHPPLDDATLSCRTLTTIPFDVVMSSRNPLSAQNEVSLRDLARQRLIIFPRQIGPRLYDHVLSMCTQEGLSPEDIVEATPAQSIIAMAASGIGVGFIASKLQQYDRPFAAYRKLSGRAPVLPLGVAHVVDNVSPALARLIDITVEVGAAVR